jgi:TetR/AcrR family transcriptional repressor of uid operon
MAVIMRHTRLNNLTIAIDDRDHRTMVNTPKTRQTLDRVLDAAMTCYGRDGITATTLDQVAREAGIGRTTLYRYVNNRDNLLSQVLLRDARQRSEELKAALRYHSDLASILVDGMLFNMRGRKSRPMFKLLFGEGQTMINSQIQLTPATFRPMATSLLRKQFLEEQARGKIRDGVTLELAAELVARLSLSLMAWPEHFLDDEAALRQFLQTMLVPAILKQ